MTLSICRSSRIPSIVLKVYLNHAQWALKEYATRGCPLRAPDHIDFLLLPVATTYSASSPLPMLLDSTSDMPRPTVEIALSVSQNSY
ncbi:hypothetical protein IG631_11809 [Alternaria alternata]|nr:hypothetical protein IG631_11809 [Alternaria alternata]